MPPPSSPTPVAGTGPAAMRDPSASPAATLGGLTPPDSAVASPMAAPPVQHVTDVGPPTVAPDGGRLPTMGGGAGTSISLPMSGPSRRTMSIAGVGIALAGIGLGAVIAVKAFKPPPPPPVPETTVGLLEAPHMIANGPDGGLDEAANAAAGNGAGGARRVRAGAGGARAATGATRAGAGGTAGAGTAGGGGGGGGAPNSGGGAGSTRTTAGGAGGSGAAAGAHAASGGSGGTASAAGGAGGSETAGGGGAAAGSGSGASAGSGGGGAAGPAAVDDPGGMPQGPSVGGYREGESTDATGRMDPTVFTFVYRHFRSQISSCHSMVSRGGPVVGTMRLRVRVGTDGHVLRTRVLNNTTGNDNLATCVQTQVHAWRYPEPEGGEVEFDYQWGFGN